ncbi:hypothetical protein Tco_0701454 [Tanacetum coccineum]
MKYHPQFNHNVYSSTIIHPTIGICSHNLPTQHLFSQPDSGLVVPVFQKGDDPIDAINHMMSFLTAVVTSPGRQTTYAAGTTRKYTPGASRSNTGKQRTIICYNCKGEGHISMHWNGSMQLTEYNNPDNLVGQCVSRVSMERNDPSTAEGNRLWHQNR